MNVLRSVLKDSKDYYRKLDAEIKKRLSKLPEGSVKKRNLRGHVYYYLQKREGSKVVHKYLGKEKPSELEGQLKERKELKAELKKVQDALKFLKRAK